MFIIIMKYLVIFFCFLFCLILILFVWQIYFEIKVFIIKIKKYLIGFKYWWDLLCYFLKSFKIVLMFLFEIFIYDVLIYIVGLIFYAFYKVGRAILSYDMLLDLLFLRYISESLITFNKLSFIIGLFLFQIVFLVYIYLQLKKVFKLLLILDLDELLPHLVLLLCTVNCYLIFFLLKKTYFIQHNFLFATLPLIYLSIFILIFYLFFLYFLLIQFLFFILKSRYPKIKNYFLVEDLFYFLCYLLFVLVIFNYSFFSWLFLPCDHKLEESELLDFLGEHLPDYKEILLDEESSKEDC